MGPADGHEGGEAADEDAGGVHERRRQPQDLLLHLRAEYIISDIDYVSK